ncbi:MAG: InlB B-repeat-containing protein [Bacteroidales bacterium]|nr:InlB B-repeat-containing protein [Bacteroidales bacterium]
MKRILFFAIITIMGILAISGCKKKETYTVSFNANGGNGTMTEQIFKEGEAQALAKNSFTRENYAFVNWSVMKDGSGTTYSDGQTITVTFNMTLYAQWRCTNPAPGPAPVDSVTVIFDANGGIGEMLPLTFVPGETKVLTANTFTKENYWFTGWNTATDGSGDAYADSQEITIEENMTLYAQWSLGVTASANGHDYVDLGLPSGLLWATCNVGADSPFAYGDYFAWGETEPKETYDWTTYIWCNGAEYTLTKYCNNPYDGNNGFTDNLTVLQASDDAATANWNADWRMPTYNEMVELKNRCSVTWSTQNGVNGRLFVGPNGNSLFLPAADNRYDGSYHGAGSYGGYWSSSLGTDAPEGAWILFFNSDMCVFDYGSRFCGQSVRAVVAQ